VYDDQGERPSIAAAFGNTLPAAVRLFVPSASGIEIVVVPSMDAKPERPEPGTLTLVMRDQHLVDVTAR